MGLIISGGGGAATVVNPTQARERLWLRSGAIAATLPRIGGGWTTGILTTSGTLSLAGGCVLPANTTITNITFVSGSAATTPTAQWFCIVKQSDLSVLKKTVDDTTTAWGSQAEKTLALSSTYTPTVDTAVYLGCLVVAGGAPNLIGVDVSFGVIENTAPILSGNSTAGLTNPASLGGTAGALTSRTGIPYAWVS